MNGGWAGVLYKDAWKAGTTYSQTRKGTDSSVKVFSCTTDLKYLQQLPIFSAKFRLFYILEHEHDITVTNTELNSYIIIKD